MNAFVFDCPTKIIFGTGKLAEAGSEAKQLGTRALLLTGRSAARKSGTLGKLTGLLKACNIEFELFEKIEPNPRVETLDEAVQLALDKNTDMVIGLGGGSVMDGSKAVAAALAHSIEEDKKVSCWEFTSAMGDQVKEVRYCQPLMLISMTAATGTEGNPASVISKWETHDKAVIYQQGIFPAVSIVDPSLMLSLDLEKTRMHAFDIMMHVLETYFSGDDKADIQDSLTEAIVKSVMRSLDILEKNLQNITARENLSWASIQALIGAGGVNLGRTGSWVMHELEHPLSGHLDVAHGQGLAALLPRYIRFLKTKRSQKILRFGKEVFGLQTDDVDAVIDHLEAWQKSHGLWFNLKDFGVNEELMQKMAEDAIRVSGGGNSYLAGPTPVTVERAVQIYQSAV